MKNKLKKNQNLKQKNVAEALTKTGAVKQMKIKYPNKIYRVKKTSNRLINKLITIFNKFQDLKMSMLKHMDVLIISATVSTWLDC